MYLSHRQVIPKVYKSKLISTCPGQLDRGFGAPWNWIDDDDDDDDDDYNDDNDDNDDGDNDGDDANDSHLKFTQVSLNH